uniref:Protein kinase domain-containing protein n=1 Tax=Panagrolaimus sp. PS1159 TaxID=55785 RepID=A0AC35GM76_9BILA
MKGRMSRVFEVKRSKDSKILAMKAHFPTDTGKATILRHEAHIYHELSVLARNLQKDDIRFLNIHDYGECSDKQFLFLTLGGQSLASFLSDEKVPNFQTALNLSFQMLNVIEQIHTLGFIHCRIRPNTFITGLKTRERFTLFIINFSLARMANPTGTAASQATAIPRNPPQIFDRYAPRCQHFGLPYHRRDDLESWFYICCDLFHPFFLPWSFEKRLKSQQMAELKEKLMKGELYHRYSVMPKPF